MTRREAREQALCLVFEGLFSDDTLPNILKTAGEARELTPEPFAAELAQGVFDNESDLDAKIEKYSIGWNKSRISKIVLAILRLAIYEIFYIDDIPVSVSINEAVELAKKYGGEGDPAFINGVLGTLVRSEKVGRE
jgi:N utilization substance protein B